MTTPNTDPYGNRFDAASAVDPIAKPWYLSKTVIAAVAGIVMAVAPKVLKLIGVDIPITQEQANAVALFVIPQAVALYGRISATHVLTGSAAKAEVLNEVAAK